MADFTRKPIVSLSMTYSTIRRGVSYWLESLHKEFKGSNQIFVAGGSIASELLREPINDIDIYFKSADNLMEVLCSEYAITGLSVDKNQIMLDNKQKSRIFFKDNVYFNFGYLTPLSLTLYPVDTNIPKIQLILYQQGEPESVVNTFDFMHCMYYLCPDMNYTINALREKAPYMDKSIHCKSLYYNIGSDRPFSAMSRLRKFLARGWTISNDELLKILSKCNDYDMGNLTDVGKIMQELSYLES